MVKLLRHRQQVEVSLASSGQQVFRKFQQFIRNTSPVSNIKVNVAADHLGLSPQNLNSICRKIAGQSSSKMINEQVILEAKRYLLHSNKSVSEIAFTLKFSDPSHFIKYFKKSSGETPQAFRSKYFQ